MESAHGRAYRPSRAAQPAGEQHHAPGTGRGKEPIDPDAAALGRMFLLLLDAYELAVVTAYRQEGGATRYFIRATTRDRQSVTRTVSGDTLLSCLEDLTGGGQRRECVVCHREKSLTEFSRLKVGPGGRNWRCKQCERERVAEHKRKKQAAAAAASKGEQAA